MTRRWAIHRLGSWLAASPLAAQVGGREPEGRITPREELVNVFEVETIAQRTLPDAAYRLIAGSDRRSFERITFRPRMLINVENLDTSADLFGEKLFAPILVGPVSGQHRFHQDAEVATVQGAGAAQTVAVISSRSSRPIAGIAAQAAAPLWFQVYPDPDRNATRSRIQEAVAAGCKAVCLTVGAPSVDWSHVEDLRKAAQTPFLLKGILMPEEARMAARNGIDGIIVSNHGGMYTHGLASPMDVLPAIVDAAGPRTAVLIDGSFRRGTDVLKAIALGAKAVLVARPAMWGLAAYGAAGVETVIRMLIGEFARDMGLCGAVNLAAIHRNLVKLHRR